MSLSLLWRERASDFTAVSGARSIVAHWPGACFTFSLPGISRTKLTLACSIWYGVQASIGGSCMFVMLRSIWPSVNNIRKSPPPGCLAKLIVVSSLADHMPASAGISTKDFMCFFLFWLISLPAIWFPIHQMYVATFRGG